MNRSSLAPLCVVLALGGCATSPPPAIPVAAFVATVSPDVPGIDVHGKKAPNVRLPFGRQSMAIPTREHHYAMEADEHGNPPSAAQIFRAFAQREAMLRESQARADVPQKSAGIQPSQWQELGPSNVAGRVRAIAFDPSNAARLLVGTASGGMWESIDRATTWRRVQDFLPNLSITTVAFDPTDPRNVYAGTGEASQALVGVGAFKSVDGGTTWAWMAATNVDANPDWRFVNRIAVHPRQGAVLVAGVTNNSLRTGGIYRSSDGGASWTKVSALKALDIAFQPDNPANLVAGLDDGAIAYSRDGGVSWTRTDPLVPNPSGRGNTARAEIAFARSEPGIVYASVDNASGEVWKSLDSGASWIRLSTPAHLAGQGDYDNAIWVDPTDANQVVVGGLDIQRSTDGGITFTAISDWRRAPPSTLPSAGAQSPHADQHALVSPPDYGVANRSLYAGNDGGVYRALDIRSAQSNGTGWNNMNSGLAVTQFNSGAGTANRVVGGTQDNGTMAFSQNAWRFWQGGDGGTVAVDPNDDSIAYGTLYYLALFRSTNGGASASYICAGITEAYNGTGTPCGAGTTQQAGFYAPILLDPNNPQRLYGGAASLWVTENARAGTPVWRTAKPPTATSANYIYAIAVHQGNPNVIWVGHGNGEVYRTSDGLAPTPTWTRVGAGVLPARRVLRFMIDRDNPNRVIAGFASYFPDNLWQTLDGGATWASLMSNLPAAPMNDIERHPTNPQWLYAATGVGLYTSENGGATWSTTNEGPANVRVFDLFWMDNATLGAATFGRGMWKVSVASSGPANYQDLWWAGAQENGWGMSISQHGAKIFAAMYIYDPQGRPIWVVLPDGAWDSGFTTYSGALYAPTGSWFGAYDASRLVVGASVGTASLAFRDSNNATLNYTINGVSGSKAISRQGFGPVDTLPAIPSYADLWWGGTAQNGWGVAISQQYKTLFAVWYTYDANGRTVWYVVPGGTWTSSNVYTGTAYRTTSSPWLGTAYNAASFSAASVGTITFTFTDLNNAVMSYTVDGVSSTRSLTRQSF